MASPYLEPALALAVIENSLLDGALQHHSALIKAILLDDLAVMEHVKLLSGILARKHHDGLLTAGVLTFIIDTQNKQVTSLCKHSAKHRQVRSKAPLYLKTMLKIQVAQKIGHIKHLVTHNHPAVAVLVVLSHLFSTDRHSRKGSRANVKNKVAQD